MGERGRGVVLRSPRRRALAAVIVAVGLLLPACSGAPGWFARPGGDGATAPGIDVSGIRVTDIPAGPEGAEIVRGFARRCAEGAEPGHCEHRALVATELAVSARVWRSARPALGYWYGAATRGALGLDSGGASAAAARVAADLRIAGWPPGDAEAASALVAASLGAGGVAAAEPPEPLSSAWRLVRLVEVTERVAPWLRYGSAGDGGALVLAVARLSGVEAADLESASASLPEGSPWPDGGGQIATSSNRLEAATLVRFDALLREVESDVEAGVAVSSLAAEWVGDLRAMLDEAAVPLRIPTSILVDAPRLELPVSFDPTATAVPDGVGFAYRRLLAVPTDGVYVSARPHVELDDLGGVRFAAAAAGLHLPGRLAVELDSPGRIPVEAIEGSRLPALGEAFDALEDLVEGAAWFPAEERRGGGTPGLSVFADGDTCFDTLRPILLEAVGHGYRPVALHTYRSNTQQLDALPVGLVPGEPAGTHVLIVRGDGYVLQPWDPEDLAEPVIVPRVTRGALLVLHRAVLELVEGGRWDEERALSIRVDDGSTDFGILAHLVGALAYRRPLDRVERDIDLLRATPESVDGVPIPLLPGGVQLVL